MKGATKKGQQKSKADEEKWLIIFCTKKAITWGDQYEKGIEGIGKQFTEQPRALVDTNGQPTKGDKSAAVILLSFQVTIHQPGSLKSPF